MSEEMPEEDEVVNEEPEADAPEEQVPEAETADGEPVSAGDLRTRANERNEFLDMLQRTRAEFSNYRKRVERERGQLRSHVIGDFVRRLLPVLDDFDRALAHADESADLIFLTLGFRSAKLVAVPWRAYMEISDPELRDATWTSSPMPRRVERRVRAHRSDD